MKLFLKTLKRNTDVIVAEVKSRKLTLKQANKKLYELCEEAHNKYPDAEPDGDIEYFIALAVREIDDFLKEKKYITPKPEEKSYILKLKPDEIELVCDALMSYIGLNGEWLKTKTDPFSQKNIPPRMSKTWYIYHKIRKLK